MGPTDEFGHMGSENGFYKGWWAEKVALVWRCSSITVEDGPKDMPSVVSLCKTDDTEGRASGKQPPVVANAGGRAKNPDMKLWLWAASSTRDLRGVFMGLGLRV